MPSWAWPNNATSSSACRDPAGLDGSIARMARRAIFRCASPGGAPSGNVHVHTGVDAQGRFGVSATDTAFMFNAAGAPTTTVATVAIASAHRTGLGLFAEADWQAKRWVRLSGGVRAEGIRSVNEPGKAAEIDSCAPNERSIVHRYLRLTNRGTVRARTAGIPHSNAFECLPRDRFEQPGICDCWT